jgi:hypothetical protein
MCILVQYLLVEEKTGRGGIGVYHGASALLSDAWVVGLVPFCGGGGE